jgi:transcriptional regulator with XRE-family HTH domain
LPSKKFNWTEGLDSILKRSYRTARDRNELIRNLTHIQRLTGFPRFAITIRASALGITRIRKQPWTASELSQLREFAGTCGRRSLAKRLGRSEYSVKAALRRMMLSSRITEGYSQTDLAELLGASPTSVRRWERMGWLAFGCHGRASETSVRRFVKMHPDQYQLSFVNEAWFKGLLFEAYNSPSPGHREKNRPTTFAEVDPNSGRAQTSTENVRAQFSIAGQKEISAFAANT